jgi:4'-phosphopantetheinyl transferase
VKVWQVDLRQPAEWVDAAERLLAADERELAARGTPEVRRRRIVARAALRIALSRQVGRAPDSLEFVQGPHGKPALAGPAAGGGLDFSVSTSGDCCLIALAEPGPIGVDVEHVLPRPGLDRIVATRFAPSEAVAIERLSGEGRLRAFYHCWTRKEAYLKARGTGLTMALDRVVVAVGEDRLESLPPDDDPSRWAVAALDPGRDFMAALVVRSDRERRALRKPSALPLDLEDGSP